MKKNFLVITIVSVLVFMSLLACNRRQGGKGNISVQSVSCDVAFRIPSSSYISFHKIDVVDGIAYVLETTGEFTTVMALDLDSGSIVWRKNPFKDDENWKRNSIFTTEYSIIGESLWSSCYYSGNVYLVEIDLKTGERHRIVQIGKTAEGFYLQGGTSCSLGKKIFFFVDKIGLCYIDTGNLIPYDVAADAYTGNVIQVLKHDLPGDTGLSVRIVENDIIGTYRNVDNYAICGMFRLDGKTLETIWHITGESFFRDYVYHKGAIYSSVDTFPVAGDEEGEYIRFVRRNWKNGKLKKNYDCTVLSETLPVVSNDYIIQTYPATYPDQPFIICLDAKNLKLHWEHYLNEFPIGMHSGSNVQVNRGIVYQPTSSGVFLYDLKTGAFLGNDSGLQASDVANIMVSFKYRDMLVIQTGTEILGIKMNFRNTKSGLLKE